jgi:hypothetical protein
VSVGGAVPSKTLSSYLSNSARFNNVKDLGYGLAEWGQGNGPRGENNKRSQGGDAGDLLGNPGGAPTPAGSMGSGGN